MDPMTLKEQLTLFKAKDESDLFRIKTDKKAKHRRVFVGGKASRVEMTADECKKLCDKISIEYLSGYEGRVIRAIITNECRDRYGDKVRANGVQLENYKKNPVVQFAHNYSQPMVANSLNVFIDRQAKNVQAEELYMDNRVDSSGHADLIFKMCSSGFMKARSIGFIPLEYKRPKDEKEREKLDLGPQGVDFTKTELLEESPVPVPANPEALQNYFKAIKEAKIYNGDDFKALEALKIFDGNMTDMFIELAKGNKGTTYTGLDSAFNDILKAPIAIKEDEKVKCEGCGNEIDYAKEPEVAAGAVKCPSCGATIDQTGKVHAAPEPEKDAIVPDEPLKAVAPITNVTVNLDTKDVIKAINDINETSKAMQKLFNDLRKSYPEHGGQAGAEKKDDLYTGDDKDTIKDLRDKKVEL